MNYKQSLKAVAQQTSVGNAQRQVDINTKHGEAPAVMSEGGRRGSGEF